MYLIHLFDRLRSHQILIAVTAFQAIQRLVDLQLGWTAIGFKNYPLDRWLVYKRGLRAVPRSGTSHIEEQAGSQPPAEQAASCRGFYRYIYHRYAVEG